jgi:hypothetical protein
MSSICAMPQGIAPAASLVTVSVNDSEQQRGPPSSLQQQRGSSPRGSNPATDAASELAATAQLEETRNTSRRAQRSYRQRQKVGMLCTACWLTVVLPKMSTKVGEPQQQPQSGGILQNRLLTAESKVAELTAKLQKLQVEKASMVLVTQIICDQKQRSSRWQTQTKSTCTETHAHIAYAAPRRTMQRQQTSCWNTARRCRAMRVPRQQCGIRKRHGGWTTPHFACPWTVCGCRGRRY